MIQKGDNSLKYAPILISSIFQDLCYAATYRISVKIVDNEETEVNVFGSFNCFLLNVVKRDEILVCNPKKSE